MDAPPLTVEALSPEAAARHISEWQHLADNCLEPNIFLEPGFALAAARHIAKHGPPHFLFVWDEDASGRRKLLAVCPLAHRGRFGRFLATRIWTHEQAPLGTPLLDCERAADALSAIFAYCRTYLPQISGLLFPILPQEGAVARLLTEGASTERRRIEIFGLHRRAMLTSGQEPQSYLKRSISSERRRRLRRARESLEARGTLTFRILRAPDELKKATEAFLALEAKGWKGRRGTAFLKSPERATFAREIAAELAVQGKYLIASLDLDGKPLAMELILQSGGRAFAWKIAYDEDFAAYSPGVLLTLDVTRVLLADTTIALTDSCAGANHPMMDHVWSERMAIADLLVAINPAHAERFTFLAKRERLYRALRSRLKDMVLWLRQRKRALGRASPK